MEGGVPVMAAEQQEETFLEKKILQLHMNPNSSAHGADHCNLHQVSAPHTTIANYKMLPLY